VTGQAIGGILSNKKLTSASQQRNLIHRVPYSVISNSYIQEPNLIDGNQRPSGNVINPSELKAFGKYPFLQICATRSKCSDSVVLFLEFKLKQNNLIGNAYIGSDNQTITVGQDQYQGVEESNDKPQIIEPEHTTMQPGIVRPPFGINLITENSSYPRDEVMQPPQSRVSGSLNLV
jgi:hypothetical protein